MKSFKKYITNGAAAIVAVCGLLVSSCSTKEAIYTPTTSTDVSFPKATANYTLDPSVKTLTVYLNRGVADKALQVPIKMKDANNLFTLSTSSVSFEAGEYQKPIIVTYDYKNFKPGTKYEFDLSFDSGVAGPASYASIACIAQLPLEYESYLNGKFVESQHSDGTKWLVSETIPFVADFGASAKLEKAKYTNEYYRITAWAGFPIEFTYNSADGMVITKATDYNNALTVYSSYFDMKVSVGGSSYLIRFKQSGWYAFYAVGEYPAAGDTAEFMYWIAKDGKYLSDGYPIDEVVMFSK